MTICVYPSKLEGEPLERHETIDRMTVNNWLRANIPSYEFRESPPISVHINGRYVPVSEWASAEFAPGDTVEIYPEAKGVETIIAAVTIAAAFTAVTMLLQPSLPKQRSNSGSDGSNLDAASLKGNKIKINSPIRELAGTRVFYPDYLIPLHRYFESPRVQVVETHLSLGKGRMQVPASRVLIGDTPMISLGDDAEFQIYGPGASVAGDERTEWWHSASEVGATSTGTAGLELTVITDIPTAPTTDVLVFSEFTVNIPMGAGSFPEEWDPGMIAIIEAQYPYTITDGVGSGVRDVITGDIAQLKLSSGDTIEITGDNAGNYIVDTVDEMAGTLTLNYADGSPATALVTGDVRMSIGFRGQRYRIIAATTSTITVERLDSVGGTDSDWLGFSDITLDDAVVILDEGEAEGGWIGPFSACPAGEKTTKIEWDVFFPAGLIRIGSKGQKIFWTVRSELEYRDADIAGPWTAVSRSYTATTYDQIGYTETIDLPYAMRPECRMRRVGAKSTIPNIQEIIQWYGLRALLSAPRSYSGITTMALRVRSGGKIAAQAEQLVRVEATRILPVRSGGVELGEQPTRSIAAWIRYVAKTIGYTDDDLDLAELDRLDAIWQARGDYYDNVVANSSTARVEINNALRAGFSELTIDRGRLRPARDEPRLTFDHMYTPQNMTSPLEREFVVNGPDDFDGVDVEYTDKRTWQVETVQCRLPGDAGLRVEVMQLEGVTDRDKAWRIGMRRRRAQKYRRYALKFSTEMDALNSRYMSYAALGDDTPGYAKSAILEAIAPSGSGQLLVSSEPFDWSAGGTHVVALRKPDGTLSGPYTATRIDDYRFTIPTPLDFVPDLSLAIEPPHIMFGPLNRWNYPALIVDISPDGRSGVNVSGVNYDSRVYDDDNGFAPD